MISPVVSVVASLAGFAAVMVWRVREGRSAVTVRKIVVPPLGMATGFCRFLAPMFRIPWTWAVVSFLVGALVLAYPLLATSRLERVGEAIMMKRSSAFFIVVVVLGIIRFAARGYLDSIISIEKTGALFFILAFGMILRWRASMYLAYRSMTAQTAGQ